MLTLQLISKRSDVEKLRTFYEEIPHIGLNLSNEDFVKAIGQRIYIEWHLDSKNKNIADQYCDYHYRGIGFSQFITDETHYVLGRKGFKWYANESGGGLTLREYKVLRDSVLKGLVRCAIDFFVETNGNTFREDNRNLRCSLEPWID